MKRRSKRERERLSDLMLCAADAVFVKRTGWFHDYGTDKAGEALHMTTADRRELRKAEKAIRLEWCPSGEWNWLDDYPHGSGRLTKAVEGALEAAYRILEGRL